MISESYGKNPVVLLCFVVFHRNNPDKVITNQRCIPRCAKITEVYLGTVPVKNCAGMIQIVINVNKKSVSFICESR